MNKITPTHLINMLKQSKGFDQTLSKVRILTLGEGKCKAELTVEEEHTNPMGGLHGGLSATLVDVISTYALFSHENGQCAHVSVDLHCSYLKGATVGDEIVIDANTVRAGKTLAYLEAVIKNKKNDEILVKGTHTKYLMQSKSL